MRVAFRLGLVVGVLAVTAGAASGAAPLRIVEAGGAKYPDRSYILTAPAGGLLTASDLRVIENGTQVTGVKLVSQGGQSTSRFAVVLAIDASESMKGKPIADALAAARAFAARRSPGQALAIVTFNRSVHVLQSFTTSRADIASALSKKPRLAYGTRIYDALAKSLAQIASANVSPASIVVLSDGTDVGSSAKPADVLKQLAGAHVRVFSVGLVSRSFDQASLARLASTSHGSYVRVDRLSELTPVFDTLGQQLSGEYVLSYRSREPLGQHVSVRVSVRGVHGVASAAYESPKLHIATAPPYRPSSIDRAIQSPVAMVIVVLLIAGLLGFAIMHVAKGGSETLLDRVGGFVSLQSGVVVDEGPSQPLLRPGGLLTRAQESIGRRRWLERLGSTLELAEIQLSAVQIVLLTLALTILAAFLFVVTVGPVGIVFAFAVPYIARALVLRKLARKRRTFAEQLPDNLDVLASALRSGHSLVGALSVVADDAAEPSKSELQRVIAEEQFGVQLEDALKVTVERMQNPDLDQVALVARLQREMGSNSAEVLDRVVETVRARMELRRLVQTLTAQGRLSRWILTALPIALALVMTLISHDYMKPLFDRTAGQVFLAFAGIMVFAGSVVIGKIIDIKV
jgi:tight adherence protein B